MKLSIKQAAEKANVSIPTIHNWIKSGKLSAQKQGKSWQIPQASLDLCLANKPAPQPVHPRGSPQARAADPSPPPLSRSTRGPDRSPRPASPHRRPISACDPRFRPCRATLPRCQRSVKKSRLHISRSDPAHDPRGAPGRVENIGNLMGPFPCPRIDRRPHL